MQLSKASIRYARALYSLAEEMQVSREVYRDIHFLMDFFSEAKDVRHLMANPVIPPHIKKKAVRMIFEGHVTDLTIRFLDLVIGKNRVTDIYGIVREYIELYRDNKGIVRAVVRSAGPLSDEEKAGFSDWLSRNFPGKGPFAFFFSIRRCDSSVRKYKGNSYGWTLREKIVYSRFIR